MTSNIKSKSNSDISDIINKIPNVNLFSRMSYNLFFFRRVFKSDDNIQITRKERFYNILSKNEVEDNFQTICSKCAYNCIITSDRFKYIDWFTKIAGTIVLGLIHLYNLDVYAIIIIAIFTCFILNSDVVGQWTNQREKYAKLSMDFNDLSDSTDENRYSKFKSLYNEYENPFLSIDKVIDNSFRLIIERKSKKINFSKELEDLEINKKSDEKIDL